MNKLLENIGTIENIVKVEKTYTKLKIFFKSKEIINLNNIEKIKGVSGIFINDKSLDIIVGNQAEIIYDKYFKNLYNK
ncbi:MAG: hypothetical protein ACRCRZ_00150 [Metamycoplasmataceae bacterium]